MEVYWGWVVCASFLTLFTLSAGIAFSFTEMLIPLSKEMDTELSILDWLGSLPSSMPMLLAPVATILYYKIGTRITVYIGVFITSVALSFTAITNHIVLMFLVYGLLSGIGLTLVVNPPFFLLDEYFPYSHPRHVLATSIIACAFPVATLVFNPLTYSLIQMVGWRATYSILALTMFIIGCLTAATFKPKANADISLDNKTFDKRDAYTEITESNVTLHRRTKVIMYSIWFIASMCKSIGYYTPYLTLVNQMVELGIPQSKASTVMSIFGAFEIVSRVITSYVGDYWKGNLLYIYVLFSFLLCLLNIAGAFAYSYTHMIVYGIALGTLGGPIIAAMYSTCSEVLLGQQVPELFTLFRVGLGSGSIIGPTVAGAIFDESGSFYMTYFMTSSVYMVACVCYGLIIIINKYELSWVYPSDNTQGNTTEFYDMSPIVEDSTSEAEAEHSIYEPKADAPVKQNGSVTTTLDTLSNS